MKKTNTPDSEKARLDTLRSLDVLDTGQEERFDQLTRISKRLFNVPIALVSLIDENRQWFKSCIGLDVKETSREISFSRHAILNDDVFIIPDTTKDQRFADNPLVLDGPKIRFYAGCPLNVNGYKLGVLCIIDQTPRNFEQKDIDALKDLASMTERELTATQLSTQDELTNIANRRGFLIFAQSRLDFCARQDIPVTIVFLDLDKFKLINDKFGHVEGDHALVAFAGMMKHVFRDSDIFARLGGDEFAILFSNIPKKQAYKALDRFNQSLNKYHQEARHEYKLPFSYGTVQFNPQKHSTIEELLAEASSLMYESKKAKSA